MSVVFKSFLGVGIFLPNLIFAQVLNDNLGKKSYSPFYLKTAFDPGPDLDSNILVSDLDIVRVRGILQRMLIADQRFRDSLMTKTLNQDQTSYFSRLMSRNDLTNQVLLSKIARNYGWPFDHKFGTGAGQTAWLIWWHASLDYKKRHFVLIEEAYKRGDISKLYYTTLKNRLDKRN